jgi:hypothetical protein
MQRSGRAVHWGGERNHTFHTVFATELGQLFLTDNVLRLIVFDEEWEAILEWIPEYIIET